MAPLTPRRLLQASVPLQNLEYHAPCSIPLQSLSVGLQFQERLRSAALLAKCLTLSSQKHQGLQSQDSGSFQ